VDAARQKENFDWQLEQANADAVEMKAAFDKASMLGSYPGSGITMSFPLAGCHGIA
jgi:hypothetical protein